MGSDPLTWHNLFETVEGLVAVATLLLAAGTVFLAWRTSRLARETKRLVGSAQDEVRAVLKQTGTMEEQVAIERASLEASFRPLLLTVPPGCVARENPGDPKILLPGGTLELHFDDVAAGTRASLPIRNEGAGVAFIQEVELTHKGVPWGGRALNAILPPGEVTLLRCIGPRGGFELPEGHPEFVVRASYSDLGGRSWETNVYVRWRPDTGGWMVSEMDVRASGVPDEEAVRSGDMLEA